MLIVTQSFAQPGVGSWFGFECPLRLILKSFPESPTSRCITMSAAARGIELLAGISAALGDQLESSRFNLCSSSSRFPCFHRWPPVFAVLKSFQQSIVILRSQVCHV
jgi:hypothetical protein